jgi:hypothetical protein
MKYGFKAKMLMRVRTNTRFDYRRRVSTTEPRITPAEKGKLPQTNSKSKPVIADFGYDK